MKKKRDGNVIYNVFELPEKVKFILFELIQAIKLKKLKLNPEHEIEFFFQTPESVSKSRLKSYFESLLQNEVKYRLINPVAVEYFHRVATTRSYLKEYAKSIGKRPKFLFPDSPKKNVLPGNSIDSIIRSVIPGVDRIYEAVKELGFTARDPSDIKEPLYQKAAVQKLAEIESQYPLIKKEFLTSEMFEFQDQQQRRDFVGKLLKKILLDQGIKKTGTYAEIYKRSNDLKLVG